jgi:hypothetical protein
MESLAWKFVVGLTASETKLTRVNDQAKRHATGLSEAPFQLSHRNDPNACPIREISLVPIKESASFARQISLALTIERRHVAAQRQTTIGVQWARLGLADAFGVYFRWRPFKGNLGAQSTLRKFRSG